MVTAMNSNSVSAVLISEDDHWSSLSLHEYCITMADITKENI